MLMQVLVQCAVNRSNRFTRQAGRYRPLDIGVSLIAAAGRAEKGRLAGHIRTMTSGIWTTEYFDCPNCGMPYTATKEEHPDKRSGSFDCQICGVEVHSWSGAYDFFGWETDKASAPVFGKKK
jgi:hypothetical protein